MMQVMVGIPLARARMALVGAVAVVGLGVSPATTIPYAEKALSAEGMRAGFVASLPQPEVAVVSGPRAARATAHKNRGGKSMVAKLSPSEQECLAAALYYEARGEGRAGQMAVAEVVVNRAHTAGYPRSVCGVVYQGNPGGATNCQFSWACNGDMHRGREPGAWSQARKLATNIGTGKLALGDTTSHALFFHATSVRPHWPGYQRTTQIGHHIFYKRIAGYRGQHIVRRHRTELASGDGMSSRAHGEYLVPESQPTIAAPLNIEVPVHMQTASTGDGA